MTLGERAHVRRLLCSHVDRSSATSNVSDKAGGWLDHARRAHSHQDRAFIEGTEDAIQLERHLAEPADVRSNPAAALELYGRIVGGSVAERGSAACVATALEEFAVHVDDMP